MTSRGINCVPDSRVYYEYLAENQLGYDDGLDWWQNQCCQFLKRLKLECHDPDAWNLCCWAESTTSKKPCGCVQKFLTDLDTNGFKSERVELLLKIYKDANEKKHLARITSNLNSSSGAIFSVNYAEYVNYVEKQRSLLKDYGLCENMLKKLLLYSNNFLYKAKSSLPKPLRSLKIKRNNPPVLDVSMVNNKCCDRNCFQVGLLKLGWLKQIQARSGKSQAERRQCIVEMLESPFYNFCQDFIAYICSCHAVTVINQRKNLPNRVKLKEKELNKSSQRRKSSLVDINKNDYVSIYQSKKPRGFAANTVNVPLSPIVCKRKDSTSKENFVTSFNGFMECNEKMDYSAFEFFGNVADESYLSHSNKFRYDMVANSTPLELFSSNGTFGHSPETCDSNTGPMKTTTGTAFKNKSSTSNVLLSQDHQLLPQCNRNLTQLTSNRMSGESKTNTVVLSPHNSTNASQIPSLESSSSTTCFSAIATGASSHQPQDYFFMTSAAKKAALPDSTSFSGIDSNNGINFVISSKNRSFIMNKPTAGSLTRDDDTHTFSSSYNSSPGNGAISAASPVSNLLPPPFFNNSSGSVSSSCSRKRSQSVSSDSLEISDPAHPNFVKENSSSSSFHAQDNQGNFHDYLFTTQGPFDYSADAIYNDDVTQSAGTDHTNMAFLQKQLECAEPNSSIEDDLFWDSSFSGLPDLSSDFLTEQESDNSSSNSNLNSILSSIPNDLIDTPNFHLSLGYFEDFDPLPPPNAQVSVSAAGEPIELVLANGKITYLPSTVASVLHS